MTDAVLFDFDGTLAPCLDLPALRREVTSLTIAHGVPRAEIESLYIVEIVDRARDWLHEHGGQADDYFAGAHRLIRDTEVAAAATTRVFDGVREMLSRLQAMSIGRGVVTRNCETAIRTMFPDIDAYCDALLARDHVEWLKPDSRHLEACLERVGARAEASVMVGDGSLDMVAGRSIGMYCVGVLSGNSDGPSLRTAGAHWILPNVVGLDRKLVSMVP